MVEPDPADAHYGVAGFGDDRAGGAGRALQVKVFTCCEVDGVLGVRSYEV